MARLAIAVAGAVIGSFIPGVGAAMGFAVGSMIGSVLFPPEGPDITGPRLNDLQVQVSSYGGVIPWAWGTARLAGNVIWSTDIVEIAHEEEQGKGGGSSYTTYEYFGRFSVALCRSSNVHNVTRIWADGKLIYDKGAAVPDFPDNDFGAILIYYVTLDQGLNKYRGAISIHMGDEDQTPSSFMEEHLGAGNVPGYRGIVRIDFNMLPLKDFGNRIPNITAEVNGSTGDLNTEYGLTVVDSLFPSSYEWAINGSNWEPEITSYETLLFPDWHRRKWVTITDYYYPTMHFNESGTVTLIDMDTFEVTIEYPWLNEDGTGNTDINFQSSGYTLKDFQTDPYTGDYWLTNMRGTSYYNYRTGSWINNVSQLVRISADAGFRYDAEAYSMPDGINTLTDEYGNLSDYMNDDHIQLIGFTEDYAVLSSWDEWGPALRIFPKTYPYDVSIWQGYKIWPIARIDMPYQFGYIMSWCWDDNGVCYFLVDYRNSNPSVDYPGPSSWRLLKLDLNGLPALTFSYGTYANVDPSLVFTDITPWSAGEGLETDVNPASGQLSYPLLMLDRSTNWLHLSHCVGETTNVTGVLERPIVGTAFTEVYGRRVGAYNTVTGQYIDVGVVGDLDEFANPTTDPSAVTQITHVWIPTDYHLSLTDYTYSNATYPIWLIEGRRPVNSDGALPTSGNTTWLVKRDFTTWQLLTQVEINSANFGVDDPGAVMYIYYQRAQHTFDNYDPLQYGHFFDPNTNNIVGPYTGQGYPPHDSRLGWDANRGLAVFTLEGANAPTVALSDIITDISVASDLAEDDIDVTDIEDIRVQGYYAGRQSTARQMIEPLQKAYFFDGVESDGKIKWVTRDGTSVGTITTDDLAAKSGAEAVDYFKEVRTQEVELPERVVLKYSSPTLEYQQGTQQEKRLSGAMRSTNQLAYELPIVLTDNEAKQIAQRVLYLTWIGRNTYEFSLPPNLIKYDPGDVITVVHEDVSYLIYLTKVELGADGVIKCEGTAHDEVVYVSTATAPVFNFTAQTVSVTGPSRIFVMDCPLLIESSDEPGLNIAAIGYGQWTGVSIYYSNDNVTYSLLTTLTTMAVAGDATTVLGDWAYPGVMDNTNTVTVEVVGTLSSVSAAELYNGTNAAMLGSEMIQFQTATLTASDTYTSTYVLSGLLRGLRGTEWATGSHLSSDEFVLVRNNGSIASISLSLSDIGNTKYYKAVTFGNAIDTATEVGVAWTGVRLKPLSPVNIVGSRDGSNNLTINWDRRARVTGGWLDSIDQTLDEPTEQYEIDVYNSGVTTVLRTLTATSESVEYSAADQTTDFGSTPSTINVKIYQISSRVGRGYAGSAAI